MKELLLMLSILCLALTGCTATKVEDQSIDRIMDTVLLEKNTLYNEVVSGYKYYIPKGMALVSRTDYNSKLRYQNIDYYLYIDVISYYYKVDNTYQETKGVYYSKKIDHQGKKGYLEINQVKDWYYIEIMYHYAKMETYVPKEKMNDAIIQICSVLSSITFQDEILDTLVGENILNYKEETFNIFKPKRETGDFLDFVREYDKAPSSSDDIQDEDKIGTNIEE